MKERKQSITEDIWKTILFQRWYRRIPKEIQKRYLDLQSDLQLLRERRFIPNNPVSILDTYSGSGAGSMALRQTYGPSPLVIAVDDCSSHQYDSLYQVRTPPSWVAKFVPVSIQSLEESTHPTFDLIMAARPSLCPGKNSPWTERCENEAYTIIALTKMLSPGGTLLYGTSWDFLLRETVLLKENFALSNLFSAVQSLNPKTSDTKDYHDEWISLSSVNPEFLATVEQNPRQLLQRFGLWQRDPYENLRGCIFLPS